METESARRRSSWRERGRMAWWAALLLGVSWAIMPPLSAHITRASFSSKQVIAKSPSLSEIAACLLFAALLIELGSAWVMRRGEKLVRQRLARGECAGCGYPVSGSAERCSECGSQLGSRPRTAAGVSFVVLARGLSIAVMATVMFHAIVPLGYEFERPSTMRSTFSINDGPAISIRVAEGGWAHRRLAGTSTIPADECAPINDVTFVNESTQATTRRRFMLNSAGRWVVTPGGFTLEDAPARLGAELDQELGMSVNMDVVSHFVKGSSILLGPRSSSASNDDPPPRGILVPGGFQVPVRPTLASVMWLLGVGIASFVTAVCILVRRAKRREA